MGRRILIVDGYNVIRATGRYSGLADRDLDMARAKLVADVAALAGGRHAVIVFDGASNPTSEGEPVDAGGVEVIFSPYGKDADTIIETLTGKHRAVGDEVDVVTSDSQTQWVVLGQGAHRVSSSEFAAQIEADESEWSESNPAGGSRSSLEDRISDSVRRTLSRWAKGGS